jgi:hypothetical protein
MHEGLGQLVHSTEELGGVGSPVFGGDMVPLGIHGLVAGMEAILGNGLDDEVLIVLDKVP